MADTVRRARAISIHHTLGVWGVLSRSRGGFCVTVAVWQIAVINGGRAVVGHTLVAVFYSNGSSDDGLRKTTTQAAPTTLPPVS